MNFPARSLQSKYPEGLPHQVSEEMKLNRYRETVCTVSNTIGCNPPTKDKEIDMYGLLVIHWEWVPEGEGCPLTTPFLVFSSEFITSL